jgi:flagellar biosynthesis protein FliQ
MDVTLIRNMLGLFSQLSVPIIGCIIGAAILVAILRVAIQIDDPVLGFAGRIAGLAIAFYLFADRVWQTIIEFSQRVWGGISYY